MIKTNIFDYIVIGAGVAGLYFTYKNLLQKNYLILEKRNYIGGRLQTINFHNQNLELGGAVIEDSNPHVIKLVKELNLPLISYKGTSYHQFKEMTVDEINNILDRIKQTFLNNKEDIQNKKLSFNQFLKIYFDDDFVNLIQNTSDYTDFYNEDVESFINYYPLKDLILKNTTIHKINGGYGVLINKLLEFVPKERIRLNKKVITISKIKELNKDKIVITCEDNTIYETRKLILCGDIGLNKINYNGFGLKLNNIFDCIGSNSFMRLYSYHDKIGLDKNLRLVNSNPLHKIIPMSDNILMSIYADNDDADFFYDILIKSGKNNFIDIVQKLLKKTNYEFTDIKDYVLRYWKIGTHYFKPNINKQIFNKIFNPEELIKDNILICGEFVSKRQGWVEGAISSVNDIHDYFVKLDNK